MTYEPAAGTTQGDPSAADTATNLRHIRSVRFAFSAVFSSGEYWVNACGNRLAPEHGTSETVGGPSSAAMRSASATWMVLSVTFRSELPSASRTRSEVSIA